MPTSEAPLPANPPAWCATKGSRPHCQREGAEALPLEVIIDSGTNTSRPAWIRSGLNGLAAFGPNPLWIEFTGVESDTGIGVSCSCAGRLVDEVIAPAIGALTSNGCTFGGRGPNCCRNSVFGTGATAGIDHVLPLPVRGNCCLGLGGALARVP